MKPILTPPFPPSPKFTTEMPRYSSTPARMKRKREASPDDDKAAIAITSSVADASNAPPQNKRPRRAAALEAASGKTSLGNGKV